MNYSNPRLSGKELIKTLQKHGFVVAITKGSHHFLKHADGRATVVPVHGKEIIGPGLLNKICTDAKIIYKDLL
jgi:predicted RNA binding protein YcfA (HicA-like mRNA interferase family)